MSCHMEGPFSLQFQPYDIIYDLIKTNIGCCLLWSVRLRHPKVSSCSPGFLRSPCICFGLLI